MSITAENLELTRYGHLPVGVIAEALPAGHARLKRAKMLKDLAETGFLPWLDARKKPVSVLTEQQLGWVAETADLSFPPAEALAPSTLSPTDTVQTAFDAFEQTTHCWIPLVDERGRYTGQCASRARLYKLQHGLLRPLRIGGLATPLGVYMTSGYYASGSGWPGLVATGVLFGLVAHLLDALSMVFYSALSAISPFIQRMGEGQQSILHMGLMLTSMLMLLRLSPIAGLHAAEHMTINAIEQDLPLTEGHIRTQPREHARCGTNLMVLIAGVQILFISLFSFRQEINPWGLMIYAGLGILLILKIWKVGGLWLQRHFTTKTPSSAQIASGIKAGQELLEKFQEAPHGMPSLAQRLWGSGMAHMLVSFLGTAYLVGWLLEQLRF